MTIAADHTKHASFNMMRFLNHIWMVGLIFGPSVAYLAWAVQRRRWGHALCAIGLWTALWGLGPAFVVSMCCKLWAYF